MSDGHERKDRTEGRDRTRLPGLTAAIMVAALGMGGCAQPDDVQPTGTVDRVAFDSLLADLAGPQAENLSNGQRWRLVASTGTGLPPTSYRLADLPEPEARGASLQQVYCVQCHGVSSPKMHTAAEWPILLRRMTMRTRTLRDRLAGERIEGAVDEMLMAGLQSANIPTAEDQDSLLAYFTRHALPAADPGEIGEDPDDLLYLEYCSLCHETPSRTAHGPEGAQALVYRMSAMMEILGMVPPSEEEKQRLTAYLQAAAE
jgi:cytochrome c5